MKQRLIATLILTLCFCWGLQAQTISASPDSGFIDDTFQPLTVSISGVGTQFISGTTTCGELDGNSIYFEQGSSALYLQNVNVISEELITVELLIPSFLQSEGDHDIVIWENAPVGCKVSCQDCFEVIDPGSGSITGLDVTTGTQGEELKVTISGENTYWSQGSPCYINSGNVAFKQGTSTIFPDNVVTVAEDTICAFITVPYNIEVGLFDVIVGEDSGCEITCEDCFEVLEPSISGLDVNTGAQGEELKVTISGENSYWSQATPCSIDAGNVVFSQGSSTIFIPDSIVIVDIDTICAFITIPDSIDIGFFDVTVGDGLDCETTCNDCFEVTANPEVEFTSTTQGGQGQQPQFALRAGSGSFTNCEFTTENVFLRLGNNIIYPTALEIIDDELLVSFDIPNNAAIGNYDLIIGDGLDYSCNFSCEGCYEVTAPPELILPNNTIGVQGEPMSLDFELTAGTYDACNLTTENVFLVLGSEIIYPASVEIVDNELLTIFNIPADATVGDYDLIVGDGLDEYGCSFECIACFTIEESVGIDPVLNAALSVYPNPFDKQIHINTDMILHDVNLQLYDAVGQLVLERQWSQLQSETIDVTDLPKGIYIFKIVAIEGEAYKQIVRH